MRRFVVLVVVLLIVGCGEDVGETAVIPKASLIEERPLPTNTQTTQPPTPSTTPTNFPTQTPQPTNLPTAAPIPTATDLVTWNDSLVMIKSVDSDEIYWSPSSNEFVIYCPIRSYESFVPDNSIAYFSAPAFESVDITPNGMYCPTHKISPLLWEVDGQQLVFSFVSGSADYSFIGLLSKDGTIFQNTGIPGLLFDFDGWINNHKLVYSNYLGWGSSNINVYDIEQDQFLASANVHASTMLEFNENYVVTSSGIEYSVDRSAAVITITPEGLDTNPPIERIHYLSFEQKNRSARGYV